MSLAEDMIEEIREKKEEQEKCVHEKVTKEESGWVCVECGLHFKPKNRREEKFLKWAKKNSWIAYDGKERLEREELEYLIAEIEAKLDEEEMIDHRENYLEGLLEKLEKVSEERKN